MQMAKFLLHELNIVRWVGLGALVIQVRIILGKNEVEGAKLINGVKCD